jgi:hypothetical protein
MKIQRISTMFLLCASLVLASSALAQSEDPTLSPSPSSLTLLNGWTNAPYSTSDAQVEKINGIVHLKGAIATTGTNDEPFVLPSGFRPSNYVYIPVDLCGATNGRLLIYPSGAVYVEVENGVWSDAQCFTSLDGASFAVNSSGFATLPLINGWTNYGGGVGNAGVKNINGIVHFRGAISTSGTNTEAFVLPSGDRPSHEVYIPVDMCDATKGRIYINPNGAVNVQAETAFSNAQCFTSLDGAWFAKTGSGFSALPLINGWYDGPYSTGTAEAAIKNGVVYLKGAIATSGSNAEPFVLPPSLRPPTMVYIPADMFGAQNGRIYIYPSGAVIAEAQSGFGYAAGFTSLDGISFVK